MTIERVYENMSASRPLQVGLFPLNTIIFPGEELPLHIFEPRYKELMRDCEATGMQFGLPFFGKDSSNLGVLVELYEVTKRFDNGELDIVVRGVEMIEVLNFYPKLSNNLYPGGDIRILSNYKQLPLNKRLVKEFEKFLNFREESLDEYIQSIDLHLYSIAGSLYMTQENKVKLLGFKSNGEKQRFLYNYLVLLNALIPQELVVSDGWYLS